ncbi:MAG: hypothetical protein EXQ87_12710 [Alphaproteobacteria bacterium]|nr:hypothetical protein [Alphaproteobacteria bacterium]
MRWLVLGLVMMFGLAWTAPAYSAPDPFRNLDRAIRVDPINLTVIRRGHNEKIVTFVLRLVVSPNTSAEDVRAKMPRLYDALFSELAGLLGLNWPDGRVVDLDFARVRMLARVAHVVGSDRIIDIVFESIGERKL